MLIQDNNGRAEEVTVITRDKFDYSFILQPDGKKVANVISDDHVAYFLATGNFTEYKTGRQPAAAEGKKEAAGSEKNPAAEKWPDESAFELTEEELAKVVADRAAKPETDKASPGSTDAESDEEWCKKWAKLGRDVFCGKRDPEDKDAFIEGVVHKNIERFNRLPRKLLTSAINKWNRMLEKAEDYPRTKIWPGKLPH